MAVKDFSSRPCRRSLVAAAVVLCLGGAPALAQSGSEVSKGRRLVDALLVLQAAGLRVVFTSGLVTPSMRVVAEPRAPTARARLDELLAPHGLAAREGPGGIIQVVRATPRTRIDSPFPRAPDGAKAHLPQQQIADTVPTTYSDLVIVRAPAGGRADVDDESVMTLDAHELQGLRGSVADDPLRLVQALPRVAAGDDFRSEFSVRGSPYRHVGVVIDGVATP